MKFSVIVPVYNTAEYLPFAIASVLANDTSEAEMIIVDDGSTDGISPAVCDEYEKNYPDLVRVIHQENKGLGGARNRGLENARGDYVIFLDSDDTLASDTLTKLSLVINESSPDVIVFGLSYLGKNGALVPVKDIPLPVGTFSPSEVPSVLTILPSACTKAWRRELFASADVLFPSRAIYEDLRTTPKLIVSAKTAAFTDTRLYNYRQREDSIMNSASLSRAGEMIDAFDDLLKWFTCRGVRDTYGRELEKLAIDHLYIAASVRVARQDSKSPMLVEFASYMKKHFPNFEANPYLSTLPMRHKLIFRLVKHEHFRLIKLLFALKG